MFNWENEILKKKKKEKKRKSSLYYAPPHQRGCPCPFSHSIYFCLASDLNKLLVCVLSHMLRCVPNNKLYLCLQCLPF